jgi:hypothetical protein
MTLDDDQRNAAAQMLSHIAALPPGKRPAVIAFVEQLAIGGRVAKGPPPFEDTTTDTKGTT